MEQTKKQTVVIYSTPTCSYCQMAKEFLDENKVKYEDIDVAEDEKAREKMVHVSGQMGVPVIIIGKQIIVGFDKDAIKRALKLK